MIKIKKTKRIFWPDALKVISIFLVVLIHTSAQVLYRWSSVLSGDISATAWNFANILNSFSRISVPFFVMLSGAFLLKEKTTVKNSTTQFLEKRLPRIMLPWFFWGTIQLFFNNSFSLNKILSNGTAEKIVKTFFGGFWFMPMILGLYLLTPIIKPFVQKATKKEFKYFFFLWFFVASLIPTLNHVWGVNISIQLPIWIQYLGYFVAGYYLVHKFKFTKKDSLKLNQQIKLLFIVSSLLIAVGTYSLTFSNSVLNESLYSYTNVFVLTSSITGFIVLKNYFVNKKFSKKVEQRITKMSKASFGIFLSHAIILEIFSKGFVGIKIHSLIVNPILALPVTTLLVFGSSLLVVLGLQRVEKKIGRKFAS